MILKTKEYNRKYRNDMGSTGNSKTRQYLKVKFLLISK